MDNGLEVRLEMVESGLKKVTGQFEDINKEFSLLAQRQIENANAIADLNKNALTNHNAQMEMLLSISTKQSQTSDKLGFIRGVLLAFGITTVTGGTAAVTVGEENLTAFISFISALKGLI